MDHRARDTDDSAPLLCHHCGRELHPGSGDFYVVKIEAFADPSPPVLDADTLTAEPRKEMERLVESLGDISPQEALDQIYRRLTLTLCGVCYRRWIENPTQA